MTVYSHSELLLPYCIFFKLNNFTNQWSPPDRSPQPGDPQPEIRGITPLPRSGLYIFKRKPQEQRTQQNNKTFLNTSELNYTSNE
jgi:hypothetical protein